MQSGNIILATADQAEVLENFIPTAQGARLRGGALEYADIGAAIVRLFHYSSGGSADLFASTATSIYDADRIAAGGSNAFGDVEGLFGGDWSTFQMSTSAGQFLLGVNGLDYLHYWDGANWNPVAAVAINDVGFDAETASFSVGETVTGGTSGASATILSIVKTSATAGTLRVGTITAGPFQDNEALTSAAGAATADGASASGSAITITGVATTALSQGWIYKERPFFVEKGTTSVWYLPAKSIGGAATEIDLGANFKLGGSVLFGATWSLDSGSGLDDVCIFVTDQGEIAVYEGTDPSSSTTWSRVGVYEIAAPLNKHSWFKAGGDLAILTNDGIIPVSEALRKDRAALQAVAISYPIEDAWKDAIANATTSYPVSSTLWQSQALLLIGTPAKVNGANVSFVANARTGAWGRITGWDVRCADVSGDVLYFGNDAGQVMIADSGGSDDGVAFIGTYVAKFSGSDNFRDAVSAGLTYRADEELLFNLYAHGDYRVSEMTAPQAAITKTGDVWGTGVWGTFVWGSTSVSTTFTQWQTVRAHGYALAPAVVITSNQTTAVNFEILSTRLRSEVGNAL